MRGLYRPLLPVASLGLVSLAAATDGCRLIFFLKKSDDFFYSSPLESDDLFCCRLLANPIFIRRLSSVLSKFSHSSCSLVVPPLVEDTLFCRSPQRLINAAFRLHLLTYLLTYLLTILP